MAESMTGELSLGARTPSSVEQWVVGIAVVALFAAVVVPVAASFAGWVAGVALAAAAVAVPWTVRRMPVRLAGARRRHPLLAAAWVLLTLLGLLQTARLAAFMVDASRLWGSAVPDRLASGHQCLAAYVHAADLSRRGVANVYHERWYPAFTADPAREPAGVASPVEGLGRWVVDPYQYPPQFLLLPRAALALTSSFDQIRTGWFVLQTLVLLAAAVLLARWVGGRRGLLAALLVPAVLASLPTMLGLQFGQFHAMAVLLGVVAMVAFEGRRDAFGGVMLAAATLAKIFPGLLVVVLVAQRRWRAIGWTLAWVALVSVLALAVLGPDPFVAFASYHLPRLASGEAFSFIERPGVPPFIVSRNFGVPAIALKLRVFGGVDLPVGVARGLSWGWALLLLGLAWHVGRRRMASRGAAVLVWLALLNLAALQSPVAPSAYVVAPMLWMLAMLVGEVHGRRWVGVTLAVAWIMLMGPPPLPDAVDVVVAGAGQGLAVALAVWLVVRRHREDALASRKH